MFFSFPSKIWFYPKAIDFRKQLNGLITVIVDSLEKNPASGELFLFRNKTANRLKLVYFDGQKFWLLYCRLEKGRFLLPSINAATFSMSCEQLQWLLSGIDFMAQPVREPQVFAHYF